MTARSTHSHDGMPHRCGTGGDACGSITGAPPAGEAEIVLRTDLAISLGRAAVAGREGPVVWRDHREGPACPS